MKKIIFAALTIGMLAVACNKMKVEKPVVNDADTIVIEDSLKTDTLKTDSVK